MTSASLTGICIYGLVLAVVTLTALFTRGWTKKVIIALVLAWIPFVLFSVAVLLTMASIKYQGDILGVLADVLRGTAPFLAIVALILLAMKLMARWRG